ncbi:Haloacid dehalogenase-like hydrolase domain-containing protein 3 [Apophysomyces ossiformis]|uniref:Haloacid dehalogenase-like hydrolase domain-containing protein 3 n=1 Tax=Apophysomyces ossiformis TaxID=679940 RepID=A0A8H7BXB3_9FUNG|nr:Haloacid dehalogenase-like hydrolase domain-containing protein 3 [Apophysomyces ossiformis]
MATSTRIRLITFDAYNTLFKPRGGLSAQYAQEAGKLGIRVSKESISRHFGNAYRKQLGRAPFYGLDRGMTPREWWEELVYDTFRSAGVQKKVLDPKFDRLFTALYKRFMTAEAYEMFPDVVSTLNDLKTQGFHMGVISNSDERLVSVVESLKLNQYFDFIMPSSLAGYEKPHPEIFRKALRLVGTSVDPKEALHIGDDEIKDYRGALEAGWNAVLLERCKLSYEDSAPALFTGHKSHFPKSILTLQDLYPLVRSLHEPTPVNEIQRASAIKAAV